MATLPLALTGGVWFLYLLGYNLSVATGIGFIALAGVAAEFGVVMLLNLKRAASELQEKGLALNPAVLDEAIREGAVLRVRPKAMTVAVILAEQEARERNIPFEVTRFALEPDGVCRPLKKEGDGRQDSTLVHSQLAR
ncbi:efflux RND transporter permease subunit [Aromatoleum aromaticum]|uniref:efflux RND transporter permease subunit n=1 Tax=Aromatoleum aromaticum TaxID=551760 RepID=UPI00031A22A6|nr:efflux RND transporter permease subunit [Aromatoleum aromaticum]